MLILETIRVALDALRVNRMRSLLTMLGIVIGIGAVIAMVALGNGARNAVRDRIANLGSTFLQVNAARVMQGGVATGSMAKITDRDAQVVLERSTHLAAVNWQQDANRQVVWKSRNTNVMIVGSVANYLEVRKYRLDRGEMFTEGDERARRKVAVLGAGVLPLLGVDNPDAMLGERIRIAGQQFTVIGVMAPKGQAGFGNPDEQILIPFSTGRFKIFGNDRLNDINALAATEEDIPEAMAEIQSALRRAHKLRVGQPDDFTVRNQTDMLATLSETTATFTTLLAGIAAVSLLVGGIGIMNIMLVSVTERTREIGVRKALGATRGNILLQFLTEAVILCLLGGAIGIAVGVGAARQFHVVMGWNTAVDAKSILVAFAFASATGLVFGVWPARRAASLDPIEALRYE